MIKEEEPSEIIKSDEMIEMNFETDFELPIKEDEFKVEELKASLKSSNV